MIRIKAKGSGVPITPAEFKGKIRNPGDVLKKIGVMLQGRFKRNFKDQSLFGKKWPARYPKQSGGKLNIAGAISDLAKRPNILARRFVDRPVLQDTGGMKQITHNVVGKNKVEVGSTKEYAGIHQKGGISIQPISGTVKKNLGILLKRTRKAAKRSKKVFGAKIDVTLKKATFRKIDKKLQRALGKTGKKKGFLKLRKESKAKGNKAELLQSKLGFLFQKTELRTKIKPRPFLGFNKELVKIAARIIKNDIPK